MGKKLGIKKLYRGIIPGTISVFNRNAVAFLAM
jgi:hypothetical protein